MTVQRCSDSQCHDTVQVVYSSALAICCRCKSISSTMYIYTVWVCISCSVAIHSKTGDLTFSLLLWFVIDQFSNYCLHLWVISVASWWFHFCIMLKDNAFRMNTRDFSYEDCAKCNLVNCVQCIWEKKESVI